MELEAESPSGVSLPQQFVSRYRAVDLLPPSPTLAEAHFSELRAKIRYYCLISIPQQAGYRRRAEQMLFREAEQHRSAAGAATLI